MFGNEWNIQTKKNIQYVDMCRLVHELKSILVYQETNEISSSKEFQVIKDLCDKMRRRERKVKPMVALPELSTPNRYLIFYFKINISMKFESQLFAVLLFCLILSLYFIYLLLCFFNLAIFKEN